MEENCGYRILINSQGMSPWALSFEARFVLRNDPRVAGRDPLTVPRHHPALLEAWDRLGAENFGEGMCSPELRTVSLGWGYRIYCDGGAEEIQEVYPIRELLQKLRLKPSDLADPDPHLALAFAGWRTNSVPSGTVEWSRVRMDLDDESSLVRQPSN